MYTLSRSARLEIAVKLMDQPTREAYNALVRYCEEHGKAPRELNGRDLKHIFTTEFEQLREDMTLADGA